MEAASNPAPPAAAPPATISGAAGAAPPTADAATCAPLAATARRVRPVSIETADSGSSESYGRAGNAHKTGNLETAKAEIVEARTARYVHDGSEKMSEEIYRSERVEVEPATATATVNRKGTQDFEIYERSERFGGSGSRGRYERRGRAESRRRARSRSTVSSSEPEPELSVFEWGADMQLTRTAVDMKEVAQYYHGKAVAMGGTGTEGTASREIPAEVRFGTSEAPPSGEPPTELPPWVPTTALSSPPKSRDLASTHKLYLIQEGFGRKAIADLLKDLGVDYGFQIAHTRGERYRQRGGVRDRSGIKVPSATAIYKTPPSLTKYGHVYGAGPLKWISVWESAHASVLLIQYIAGYRPIAAKGFEEALADTLGQYTAAIAAGLVRGVVAQLVHSDWLDYFEHIETGEGHRWQRGYLDEDKDLCGNIAWALEQNLVTSQLCEKESHRARHSHARNVHKNGDAGAKRPDEPPPAYDTLDAVNADDWKELIARLHRMMAVLSFQQARTTPPASPVVRMRSRGPSVRGPIFGRPINGASVDIPALPPTSDTPQKQNSLGRVTYMGGILLPFSIVAGIMSMSDPYGPGNNMFWIYWVITIPITCLTLAIIYADDIRSSYVYKQMSYERLQEAIKMGAVEDPNDKFLDSASDIDYVEVETDRPYIPEMALRRSVPRLREERLLSGTADVDAEQGQGREDNVHEHEREDSRSPPRWARRERIQRTPSPPLPSGRLGSRPLRPQRSRVYTRPEEPLRSEDARHRVSAPPPPLMRPGMVPYSAVGVGLGGMVGGSAPELRPVEAVLEVGEEANNIDQGNVELATSVSHARIRRRFPLDPRRWVTAFSARRPATKAQYDEPVDIEMSRPSHQPSRLVYRPSGRPVYRPSSDRPVRVRHRSSYRPGEYDRPGTAGGMYTRGRNIAIPGYPAIVLEESPGGEQRVYRREKLGWGGALKTMVGYERHPQAD